jgi:hypothetical protein
MQMGQGLHLGKGLGQQKIPLLGYLVDLVEIEVELFESWQIG